MNKSYRLVWRASSAEWVVAAETSRGRTKKSTRAVAAAGVLATALSAPSVVAAPPPPPAPTTLPTGGQVVAGQATIATAGATMNIQQSTDKAILNWQSFSIGAGAAVNFQQPSASSVALNRVLGQDPSAIYGSLTANGQVFLVNPNGVLFAPGARVDVGGLVASTMDIRNEDFLGGTYRFLRNGATGSVINQGSIVARYAALLAPEVRNEGVIAARMGTVALAAGEAVTLGITGERLVDVQVDKATIDTLVENRNLVKVDAGTVVMSAQSVNTLLGRVVNSGAVEANGIVADGGTVRLTASSNIELGGSISADAGANGRGGTIVAIADPGNAASRTDVTGGLSAKGGTQSGDGGFIETSASHLKVANTARVNTSAANGRTGSWLLDPTDFTVAATGGDIDGATLAGFLGSNNVTIQTGTGTDTSTDRFGASGTNGDIFVNDAVTWSANTLLTIRAARSIFVNSAITASGSTGSGVALEFGQGLTLLDPPPFGGEIVAIRAPINLTANSSFSMKFRSDGATENYTVIASEAALRGITNMTAKYALGANIDASGTEWTPIGTDVVPFAGQFDGLGHTVSGMHRDQGNESNVGMFASIDFSGMVRNLKLTGVNFAGMNNVGALAGQNSGFILGVSSAGTVTGQDVTGTNVNGVVAIGGLVGFNQGGIFESSSSVNVSAITGDQTTFAATGSSGGIGGLVGVHESFGPGSVLTNVFATGSVTGLSNVGGLVGFANAPVGFAYSTGVVSNNGTSGAVGGLIGALGASAAVPGMLLETYWDTDTSFQGASASTGANFSTGLTTTQMKTAATFAAWPTEVWTIADGSYPVLKALSVSGGGGGGGGTQSVIITISDIARFYGDPNPTISFTFGSLLVGDSLTGVDWGTSASTLNASTTPYAFSTSGLLSPQFTFAPGHSIANYNISYSNNFLTVNPRPITVTPTSGQSKVYNGQGGSDPTLTYTVSTTATGDALVGTDALSGVLGRAAGSNVGNYAIQQGALAAPSGNYQLTFTSGVNFGITPKALTVTGLSAPSSKVYDATTNATVSGTATLQAAQAPGEGTTSDGIPYTGDTVLVAGPATGTYNSKDVGVGTLVTFGPLTTTNTNYTIASGTQAATITPKALTVTGLSAPSSKVYDATTNATVTGTAALQSAQAPGAGTTSDGIPYTDDTVNITGTATGTYNIKDVGATTVTFGGLNPNNTNYTITGTQAATITPKELGAPSGVFEVPASKVYDGTTVASVARGPVPSLSPSTVAVGFGNATDGLAYVGDAVDYVRSGPLTGTYNDKNVGLGTLVTVTGALQGAQAGNYQVTRAATITPKALVVTGLSAPSTKVYDATTTAAVSGTAALQAAEAASFGTGSDGKPYTDDTVPIAGTATGTYNSKDVGVGTLVTFGGLTTTNTNYTITGTQVAAITPKALTVTGLSVPVFKVYDGTRNAVVSGTATLQAAEAASFGTGSDGKPYTGESVPISGTATGTYDVKDASLATLVTFGGLSTTNNNYTLIAGSQDATIAQATVGLSATKVYDGTTGLSSTQVTVTGVNGESLLAFSATANSKDVGAGNFIKSFTLAPGTTGTIGNVNNYQQPTLNAANAPVTINKANLTLSGERVYDATTNVDGSILTAKGVGTEAFAVTGSSAVASKNVVTDTAGEVTSTPLTSVSGLMLGARTTASPVTTLAGNYNALSTTGSKVTITKKTLSVLEFGPVDGLTPQGGILGVSELVGGQSAGAGGPVAFTTTGIGTGSATDGKVYQGDQILGSTRLVGKVTDFLGKEGDQNLYRISIPFSSAFEGADASNYTLTGTAVSAKIRASAAAVSFQITLGFALSTIGLTSNTPLPSTITAVTNALGGKSNSSISGSLLVNIIQNVIREDTPGTTFSGIVESLKIGGITLTPDQSQALQSFLSPSDGGVVQLTIDMESLTQ